MSYRYLNRLHFSVRLKNRPITRTAIFLNIRFFKPFDLRSFTSCDQLQNYHSVNLNFLNEQIISAPQNKFYPRLFKTFSAQNCSDYG